MISQFSSELAKGSPLDIADVIARIMLEDTGEALDAVLIDANPATAVRPAGLASGAIAVAPATAGPMAVETDVANLIAALQPATRIAFAANPGQAAVLAMKIDTDLFR